MINWKPVIGYDEREYRTQPLEPEPPQVPKALKEVLTGNVKWATNGYFTIHMTDLGTLHVLTYGSFDYCASNIEPDLEGYLQGEYNRHLSEDFNTFIDRGKFYSTKEALWVETEAM